MTEGREKFWSDKDNKIKYSERLSKKNLENWKNKDYRLKMTCMLSKVNKEYIQNHPEIRQIMSERATNTLKKLWKNPEYRKSMHEKIIKGNKNHTTNNTGQVKFLKICKEVLNKEGTLNEGLYEQYRKKIYDYGRAPNWDNAFSKYYSEKEAAQIVDDAFNNHKIAYTQILEEREDVYDLTIENTHNFALEAGVFVHNSIDGDSAAAMRYTEARLAKISDEMLQDIDKETVNFTANFDGTLQEPIVLPSKFPNLLVNGSSGIAVGMATNIPPHNLQESCEAVIALINNPVITTEELCEIVKGPDFPTAAEIIGKKGIIDAYNHGKGSIKIRSVIDIEEKKGKKKLIVKQIPYQVNKSQLVEDIAALVHDKKITEISDLRDESDRDGVRIVIELKKDANPEIVKNLLYNFSRLEDTFGINMIALVDNEPKLLSLKSYFTYYLDHRITIVRKRCMFDLKKAEERAHILEGLRIALANIDAVVALIKKSTSGEDAKNGLISNYALTEVQAQAILDMKLQKIAALEQEKINNEYDGLMKTITELKEILGSESKIRNIIKDEMREIIEKYGKNNPRRTKIIDVPDEELDFVMEDLIPNELVVITMTHSGYVKRMPLEAYKVQNRGGKGIIASDLREGDFIEDVFVAKTHSYLLIFTNKGKLYWLKVYKVPDTSRQSLGKAIVNLLELAAEEKVNAIIPVSEFDDKHYLVMTTKNGTIKKTNLVEFSNPRKGGILAINIDEENNDFLINVVMTDGTKNLMLATAKGQAARFNEQDVRSTGRNSSGVRGIRLAKDDSVVGMIIAEEDKQILTITENGYGKRTAIADYRLISRGGKGVRNIICSERNGQVVGILGIKDTDEVMFISKKGILIRTEAGQISIVGRNTQGVRLIKLSSGDQAVSMTKIMKE
jgi:DNA gyrase subunit A